MEQTQMTNPAGKPESGGVQSKWLLLIAIILGILVAVIYNAHIHAVKKSFEQDKIIVIEIAKPLKSGGRLTRQHIRQHEIIKEIAGDIKGLVPWNRRAQLLLKGGKKVNKALTIGEKLRWDDLLDAHSSRPSNKISPGKQAFTVDIDTNQSFGDALSPGDTINLWGCFVTKDNPRQQNYNIISGLRVINIGGMGANTQTSKGRVARSYNRITVEATPEIIKQLLNLRTHSIGKFSFSMNSESDPTKPRNYQKINPELADLTKFSKTVTKRSGGSTRINKMD